MEKKIPGHIKRKTILLRPAVNVFLFFQFVTHFAFFFRGHFLLYALIASSFLCPDAAMMCMALKKGSIIPIHRYMHVGSSWKIIFDFGAIERYTLRINFTAAACHTQCFMTVIIPYNKLHDNSLHKSVGTKCQ